MTGKIFVSYRRTDEAGSAGRLFDRLEEKFPNKQVFMDVDSIPAGEDFKRLIETQVDECDVLLAVIGKGWIDARDDDGRRRLDQEGDFVRIEISSALRRDKRVIPVLVGDAQVPREEQLPNDLKALAGRNAVRLSYDRFKVDANGLIEAIENALDDAEAKRRLAIEVAAERERRRRARGAGRSLGFTGLRTKFAIIGALAFTLIGAVTWYFTSEPHVDDKPIETRKLLAPDISSDEIEKLKNQGTSLGATSCDVVTESDKRVLVCRWSPALNFSPTSSGERIRKWLNAGGQEPAPERVAALQKWMSEDELDPRLRDIPVEVLVSGEEALLESDRQRALGELKIP